MRRLILILSLSIIWVAILTFASSQGSSSVAAATLPPCTAYQLPEQIGRSCRYAFQPNQTVSIASSVYYVWLRVAPSSEASQIATVYSFIQPAMRIMAGAARWDGRQWWWQVRAVANAQVYGWVEQASLVAGTLRPATPVPAKVVTSVAAYQTFEHGFMLWTANDDRIYLFAKLYGAGDITWSYALTDYQAISDTVSETPPTGLFKPVRGFARAWNHNRSGLKESPFGWATAPETAITATLTTRTEYDLFRTEPIVYVEKFQLSNGKTVTITRGRGFYWTVSP